jgi:general stress protein CsbA
MEIKKITESQKPLEISMPDIPKQSTERVAISANLALNAYTVTVGSFFSVFVPRSYSAENATCMASVNVSNLTLYNQIVFACNSLTAFLLAISYLYEYYRENWMVTYFDIDDTLLETNIENDIKKYPKLEEDFLRITRRYYVLFIVTGVVTIINIVLSAILISQYYSGFQSITTFLTSLIAIGQFLYKSMKISLVSKNDFKAQSVFLTKQIQFNIVRKL